MMDDWIAKGIPFFTPPGTRYEYSNYAFGLLGRIVTKASAVPYEQYVHDEILSKLHMDASTFQFADVPSRAGRSATAPAGRDLRGRTAVAARCVRSYGRPADHRH